MSTSTVPVLPAWSPTLMEPRPIGKIVPAWVTKSVPLPVPPTVSCAWRAAVLGAMFVSPLLIHSCGVPVVLETVSSLLAGQRS